MPTVQINRDKQHVACAKGTTKKPVIGLRLSFCGLSISDTPATALPRESFPWPEYPPSPRRHQSSTVPFCFEYLRRYRFPFYNFGRLACGASPRLEFPTVTLPAA